MLHTHHQDRHYVASVEAERQRRSDLNAVVSAAGRGDQSAWSNLVAHFRGRIMRVARSHGLNAYQADDVAQETWLRLDRGLGSLRDPQALGAWLDTTARRESLRTLRDHRNETLTDQEIGTEVALPDDPHGELMQERREAMAEALQSLPERHQALMTSLLADPAPSYAEVASELGIPIGSIGPIRGRCVERLRVELVGKAD
jgi:RNA polymerase sigma factor (sigma-70 family)